MVLCCAGTVIKQGKEPCLKQEDNRGYDEKQQHADIGNRHTDYLDDTDDNCHDDKCDEVGYKTDLPDMGKDCTEIKCLAKTVRAGKADNCGGHNDLDNNPDDDQDDDREEETADQRHQSLGICRSRGGHCHCGSDKCRQADNERYDEDGYPVDQPYDEEFDPIDEHATPVI